MLFRILEPGTFRSRSRVFTGTPYLLCRFNTQSLAFVRIPIHTVVATFGPNNIPPLSKLLLLIPLNAFQNLNKPAFRIVLKLFTHLEEPDHKRLLLNHVLQSIRTWF